MEAGARETDHTHNTTVRPQYHAALSYIDTYRSIPAKSRDITQVLAEGTSDIGIILDGAFFVDMCVLAQAA